MQSNKRPPASVLFIFGGSGDLNYRKLTPALYNLFLDNWMPDQFAIAGIGRSAYSNEKYHEHLLDGVTKFSRRKGKQNGNRPDQGRSKRHARRRLFGDPAVGARAQGSQIS